MILAKAVICPMCGCAQPAIPGSGHSTPGAAAGPSQSRNRMACGLLAILVGPLGIHKFILGYTVAGVIMLLVSVVGACAFGIGPLVMFGIGIAEGIIYLTKSEAEFHQTYEVGRREWF